MTLRVTQRLTYTLTLQIECRCWWLTLVLLEHMHLSVHFLVAHALSVDVGG